MNGRAGAVCTSIRKYAVIALLLPSSICYAQGGKEAVVGAWKLVSIERVRETGEVERPDDWMGKNPTGVVIYDPAGQMSVQFMRDPRPTFMSGAWFTASLEEKKDAFEGYYAYFGTYEVNEKEGSILHRVQGSLRPEEVGISYKRVFKISGNRLTLTTPELRRVTFERVSK
jgi:hypothetical protein